MTGRPDPAILPGVLDRARGALLGQLAGDALGTTVEFETAAAIAARYPDGLREIVGGGPFHVRPGQVTDDGELALALARCLVAGGRYDPDRVAAAYLAWYESGPFDIGGTTPRPLGVGSSVALDWRGVSRPGPRPRARPTARSCG